MEIEHHLHQHLLTLCENYIDNGRHICHSCGNPSFDKSLVAATVSLIPADALLATKLDFQVVSLFASFSGPNRFSSVTVHIVLSDLKKNLVLIAIFVRKITEIISSVVICMCDFQIGFECLAIFVKYHEVREHIQHFDHFHPLTLLEVDIIRHCKLCHKSINGRRSYGYAPYKFYIHGSCSEFLQEI